MTKPRLPVVGSTAASTAFCSATVEGPGPHGTAMRLHFDSNGKITAGNGTLLEPRPNALSLRHVDDCPQSTPTCRAACYVENLKTAQGDLYDLFVENSNTVRTFLRDPELAAEWCEIVASWIRASASGGFRWHTSGDVLSLAHAEWIRDVSLEAAPVRSWIYTRSFDMLAALCEAATFRGGPLAVNLSCDRDNFDQAIRAARKHGGAGGGPRLCYLAVALDDAADLMYLRADDVIFPDYALRPKGAASFAESDWWRSLSQFQRGLVCPVDAVGKSEQRRCDLPGQGRCDRCTR